MFRRDLGVDLSGLEIGMAQELLDFSDVYPFVEEVRGEAVAEGMGRDLLFDAGSLGCLGDDLLDVPGRERTLSSAWKQEVFAIL